MELCTILRPECTTCATPGSKKKVLELISDLVAAQYPTLSSQEIFESLVAREKMGSTGIGNGIAIPHGRLADIDQPIAILIKCEEPIAFDAIDKQPVDIFICTTGACRPMSAALKYLVLHGRKAERQANIKAITQDA